MAFAWLEAAIRQNAPPRQREALLAALKQERRAAERALREKTRRRREAQAELRGNFREAARSAFAKQEGRTFRPPQSRKSRHHPVKPRQW